MAPHRAQGGDRVADGRGRLPALPLVGFAGEHPLDHLLDYVVVELCEADWPSSGTIQSSMTWR